MQSLKILLPWPGCDPLTSHNLWLLNFESCTLHSSPPAPPNPTQLLGGGKDYQRKLQRVRTKHEHHWSARCSKQLLLDIYIYILYIIIIIIIITIITSITFYYDLHASTGDCAPIFVLLHVLVQIYCRKNLAAYILLFIYLIWVTVLLSFFMVIV